jgi:hypothetical protein
LIKIQEDIIMPREDDKVEYEPPFFKNSGFTVKVVAKPLSQLRFQLLETLIEREKKDKQLSDQLPGSSTKSWLKDIAGGSPIYHQLGTQTFFVLASSPGEVEEAVNRANCSVHP